MIYSLLDANCPVHSSLSIQELSGFDTPLGVFWTCLFGTEAAYRVGHSRPDGSDAHRQQGEAHHCSAGEGEDPPAYRDAVNEAFQPFMERPPGYRRRDDEGDEEQDYEFF